MLFIADAQKRKSSDPTTLYYSVRRIRILSTIILTSVISFMMVLPVVILYQLSRVSKAPKEGGNEAQNPASSAPSNAISIASLMVMIAFTVIFCGTMAAMTPASRQELFGASAAYCAVLVVFVSNFSNGDNA